MNTYEVSYIFFQEWMSTYIGHHLIKELSEIVLDYTIDIPFYIHKWIDCKDTNDDWFESQVIDINHKEQLITVHYKGWKDKYDEKFCYSRNHSTHKCEYRHVNNNIEKLNTCTVIPDGYAKHFHVYSDGCRFKVLDTSDTIQDVSIIDTKIIENQLMYLISYIDWDSKYDEWINYDSYRIINTDNSEDDHLDALDIF